MIVSGEKKEEYRDVTEYWAKRFLSHKTVLNPFFFVRFRHGYATDAPEIIFQCMDITIKEGKLGWGAEPETKYFVITLGEKITAEQYFLSTMHNHLT